MGLFYSAAFFTAALCTFALAVYGYYFPRESFGSYWPGILLLSVIFLIGGRVMYSAHRFCHNGGAIHLFKYMGVLLTVNLIIGLAAYIHIFLAVIVGWPIGELAVRLINKIHHDVRKAHLTPYELAKKLGFVGTEQEFVESLRGPVGPTSEVLK